MLHRVTRVRGSEVRCVDGHIGYVEDFYFDDAAWTIRYIVAHTGRRHSALVSPEAVKAGWGLPGFELTLTRAQVQTSPEIDHERALSRPEEERILDHFGHPLYWKTESRSGWTPNLCSTREVIGDHIQASDGEIGHVSDFLIDEATWGLEYLVVDTSNWLGVASVLIRPVSLKGIDWPKSKLKVALSRDAVKHSPAMDTVEITPGEAGAPFTIT